MANPTSAQIDAAVPADGTPNRAQTNALLKNIAGAIDAAVVERGTSGNSHWTRWADGTQIIWGLSTAASSATGASGSLYQSGVIAFVFPVSFVGKPVVTSSMEYVSGALGWCSAVLNSGSTGVDARLLAGNNVAQARLGYMAVGRWF